MECVYRCTLTNSQGSGDAVVDQDNECALAMWATSQGMPCKTEGEDVARVYSYVYTTS
jgi:hypothetical protein